MLRARLIVVLFGISVLTACGTDSSDPDGDAGSDGMAGMGGENGDENGGGGATAMDNGSSDVPDSGTDDPEDETELADDDAGLDDDDAGLDDDDAGLDDDGVDAGVDAGDDDDTDTTPPTILSVVPEQGATGVEEDATIVITFSEPMRRADTQAAYQSATEGITAASVTFNWNENDDVLTITPNAPLSYQESEDPDAPALEFAYTVTTTATDSAGNPLANDFHGEFSTLRRISRALGKVGGNQQNHALSGAARSNDDTPTTTGRVGFTENNVGHRAIFTMDLSALPDEIVEVEEAIFRLRQTHITGDPFTELGQLSIHHLVEIEELNIDAYESLVASNRLGEFTTETANHEWRPYDVTDQVVEDLEHREDRQDRSQFGFRFNAATGDGVNRYVDYYVTSATHWPRILITYLTP